MLLETFSADVPGVLVVGLKCVPVQSREQLVVVEQQMQTLSFTQRTVTAGAATIFATAGIAHFLVPAPLTRMIPPYLPAHFALVLVSGLFEIAGGIGLLVPRLRRTAAWGLSALLVAILPANVYMAIHPAETGFGAFPSLLLWIRILLLPVFIWGLLWCSSPRRDGTGGRSSCTASAQN
jgi:uncharacterized membrane protein